MSRTTVWRDPDTLSATIRQIAIDNGTPNVMPTLEQMGDTPGLASWVRVKEGGVRKLSGKLNLIMKPNVLPSNRAEGCEHRVLKGSTVYVHTKSNIYPAVVLDKSREAGGLIVLVFNKKLTRKHVRYGKEPTSKYQWCYQDDIPREMLMVST